MRMTIVFDDQNHPDVESEEDKNAPRRITKIMSNKFGDEVAEYASMTQFYDCETWIKMLDDFVAVLEHAFGYEIADRITITPSFSLNAEDYNVKLNIQTQEQKQDAKKKKSK